MASSSKSPPKSLNSFSFGKALTQKQVDKYNNPPQPQTPPLYADDGVRFEGKYKEVSGANAVSVVPQEKLNDIEEFWFPITYPTDDYQQRPSFPRRFFCTSITYSSSYAGGGGVYGYAEIQDTTAAGIQGAMKYVHKLAPLNAQMQVIFDPPLEFTSNGFRILSGGGHTSVMTFHYVFYGYLEPKK